MMASLPRILDFLPGAKRLRAADEIARRAVATKTLLTSWVEQFGRADAPNIAAIELNVARGDHAEIDLEDARREYDIQLSPGIRICRVYVSSPDVSLMLCDGSEGSILDTHRHDDHDEVIFLISGRMKSQTSARVLTPDSPVEFIPSGTRHGYRLDRDSRWVVLFRPPLPIRLREDSSSND